MQWPRLIFGLTPKEKEWMQRMTHHLWLLELQAPWGRDFRPEKELGSHHQHRGRLHQKYGRQKNQPCQITKIIKQCSQISFSCSVHCFMQSGVFAGSGNINEDRNNRSEMEGGSVTLPHYMYVAFFGGSTIQSNSSSLSAFKVANRTPISSSRWFRIFAADTWQTKWGMERKNLEQSSISSKHCKLLEKNSVIFTELQNSLIFKVFPGFEIFYLL